MNKKKLKETMEIISQMDDMQLLITTISVARAEAIAHYIMLETRKDLSDDLALYMVSLVGRLNANMVKKEFLNRTAVSTPTPSKGENEK